MIVVLLGCHGVGKTTLGAALARHMGVPFHDEVGRRLAEDPALRPRGGTAAEAQSAFDEAVFDEELARDAAWSASAGRIVETWHPGNLAYAARRSPRVATERLGAVRASCKRGRVVAIPLVASRGTLARRQSEPGDPAFFRAVGREGVVWARALGLEVLPAIHTDRASADELAERVASILVAEQSEKTPLARLRGEELERT